jgi:hypothetical protein
MWIIAFDLEERTKERVREAGRSRSHFAISQFLGW